MNARSTDLARLRRPPGRCRSRAKVGASPRRGSRLRNAAGRSLITAPLVIMLSSAHPPVASESFTKSGSDRLLFGNLLSALPDFSQLRTSAAVGADPAVPDKQQLLFELMSDDPALELTPATPFFALSNDSVSIGRALDCLTAAVYYEAASESLDGQRAVAQVVLNRVRHPSFPQSICGVVFQGSERITGCQFTFTCDGSLARRPSATGWARARRVAQAALGGYVFPGVGLATHYHTIWIRPYWSSSLTNLTTIGAHTFYRWSGGAGQAHAFGGSYSGLETVSTAQVLKEAGEGQDEAELELAEATKAAEPEPLRLASADEGSAETEPPSDAPEPPRSARPRALRLASRDPVPEADAVAVAERAAATEPSVAGGASAEGSAI